MDMFYDYNISIMPCRHKTMLVAAHLYTSFERCALTNTPKVNESTQIV